MGSSNTTCVTHALFFSPPSLRIALNQFAQRGWLTYTDLVTVWDIMDTQKALLTATKHVTKVCAGLSPCSSVYGHLQHIQCMCPPDYIIVMSCKWLKLYVMLS